MRGMKLRFGLRTSFIAIAIASLPMAWVAYYLNWIRQRHQLLRECRQVLPTCAIEMDAPWPLALFYEQPCTAVLIVTADQLDKAKRSFPEADVIEEGPDFDPK